MSTSCGSQSTSCGTQTTAQRITQRMEETGRKRTKGGIYAIASDEHNVHCLTEDLLDTWWRALSPEEKAVIYELHLDGALEEPVDTRIEAQRYSAGTAFFSLTADLRRFTQQLLEQQQKEVARAN